MPTPTYDLITSVTLASTSSEVVFSSIPQGYRDIVVVVANLSASTANTLFARLNGDTGANYSFVEATGDSVGAKSSTGSSGTNGLLMGAVYQGLPTSGVSQSVLQIMDYSATDKHKTGLARYGSASKNEVDMSASRWANTAAVTSITLRVSGTSVNLNSGTSCSLYGIVS
jgi:hypothetical protein